jgi:pimeloyl-ACP methyl ester carboxylesterase
LFVHGLAESGEAWRGWVPYFSRRYRVARIDLRGFGRSTPMPALRPRFPATALSPAKRSTSA